MMCVCVCVCVCVCSVCVVCVCVRVCVWVCVCVINRDSKPVVGLIRSGTSCLTQNQSEYFLPEK